MTLILSGTDGLSDIDGSAATPAIRGTDANTGIFFGADIIGFAEGGAEVARFNADAQFVTAAGTASLPVITTTGDVNTGIFFPAADTIAFAEGGVEAMRIDSDGDVGIGTSSPAYPLTLGNNKQFGSLNTAGAAVPLAILNGSNNLVFGDDSANTGSLTVQSRAETKFVLNGSERMRISDSGDLLLGVTSAFNSGKQCIAFSGATRQGLNIRNNADNPSDIYVGFYNAFGTNTGAIRSGGSTTSYVTSSDYRLKENVQPLVNALDKVMALNPVSYTWKSGGEDNGFIAHELQLILPNAVSGEKDAVNEDGTINPQGVDYGRLTPILTAALQEAIAEIQLLKTRVAELEAK